MKTGPTEPRSTVLTEAEEALIVAFRRLTLLPLDDCLYALQPTVQRVFVIRESRISPRAPHRSFLHIRFRAFAWIRGVCTASGRPCPACIRPALIDLGLQVPVRVRGGQGTTFATNGNAKRGSRSTVVVPVSKRGTMP